MMTPEERELLELYNRQMMLLVRGDLFLSERRGD